MPRRQRKGRKPVRRAPARRMPRVRSTALMTGLRKKNSNIATVTETLDRLSFGAQDTANVIYGIYSVSLAAFKRASQVAANYQFYRIAKIEMKFRPYKDTFVSGSGVAGSLPYLYYIIDKNESVPLNNLDFDQLREMGAKAVRFDDRTLTISWVPRVSMSVNDDGGQTPWQLSKDAPWLNTNGNSGDALAPWTASSVDHKGLVYGVQQVIASTPEYLYETDLICHFEFKDPLVYNADVSGNAVTVKKF